MKNPLIKMSVLALTLMTTACLTNQAVKKDVDYNNLEEFSSLKSKSNMTELSNKFLSVNNEDPIVDAKKIIIVGFNAYFYMTDVKVAEGGGGIYKNLKVKSYVDVAPSDKLMQAETDKAYADIVKKLENAGYEVLNRKLIYKDEDYKESAEEKGVASGTQFYYAGRDLKVFSQGGDKVIGFGGGDPVTHETQVHSILGTLYNIGNDNDAWAINIAYISDMTNFKTQEEMTEVGIFADSGYYTTFVFNGFYGSDYLQMASKNVVASKKSVGSIVENENAGHEISDNTNQFKSYRSILNLDSEKFSLVASDNYQDVNDLILAKFKSVKAGN